MNAPLMIDTDEVAYSFPLNAVHIGEAFAAKNNDRPTLALAHISIANGSMVASSADGYCAGVMTTEIVSWKPIHKDEVTPVANAEFLLSRPQLKMLRAMEKPTGDRDPVMAINAEGRVRIGNPRQHMWVHPFPKDMAFPDIRKLLDVKAEKLTRLTMNPEILGRINALARRVGAVHLRFFAATETTAIRVEFSGYGREKETYEILLMPMVVSEGSR